MTKGTVFYETQCRFIYIPGTDGGTRLRRAVTVASATCSGLYFVAQDWPAVTMFGFSRVPSRKMW